MSATAVGVCERLATLARSGYTIRGALIEVPARIDKTDAAVTAASRRAALGAPIEDCVAALEPLFGASCPQLAACLGVSRDNGTDWAERVDDLAAFLRARNERAAAAATAGAGATLSARTIAVLPLLLIPVLMREIDEAFVALSVAAGVALGYAGYRWLMHIVPVPPDDPRAAVLAASIAASLDAGTSVDRAIRHGAAGDPQLDLVARLVELGAPWTIALARVVPELAGPLRDVRLAGLPVRDAFERAAALVRDDSAREFSRHVARAPVKMVVPLVCCILPSFVLIAIVPLVRGLAQTS
ncbi:MAG: hypothetical protein ACRDLB_08460 [Actinomycetota bacterium]